jgi:hypothetical protein
MAPDTQALRAIVDGSLFQTRNENADARRQPTKVSTP